MSPGWRLLRDSWVIHPAPIWYWNMMSTRAQTRTRKQAIKGTCWPTGTPLIFRKRICRDTVFRCIGRFQIMTAIRMQRIIIFQPPIFFSHNFENEKKTLVRVDKFDDFFNKHTEVTRIKKKKVIDLVIFKVKNSTKIVGLCTMPPSKRNS